MQYNSIFESVKQSVGLHQAASFYGIHPTRNGKALCPFHPDHYPSLQLYNDHYHCYSCGAHGDVVSLVADLFHLTPYDAAVKLSEDLCINIDTDSLTDSIPVACSGPIPSVSADKRSASLPIPTAEKDLLGRRKRFYFAYCRYADKLRHWLRLAAPKPGEIPSDAFRTVCMELLMAEQCLDILHPGSSFSDRDIEELVNQKEMEVSAIEAITGS